jgi:hypothetical protein
MDDAFFLILANKRLVRYTCSFLYPQKKKSMGVKSGDLAAYATGPPLPIHLAGNVVSSNCLTGKPKSGGAPSFPNKNV